MMTTGEAIMIFVIMVIGFLINIFWPKIDKKLQDWYNKRK